MGGEELSDMAKQDRDRRARERERRGARGAEREQNDTCLCG